VSSSNSQSQAVHVMTDNNRRLHVFFWYAAALVVYCSGAILAAHYYPSGFDWHYTVASALASQKHNPTGSAWFAGTLSLSMCLLWRYVSILRQAMLTPHALARFAFVILRIGLASGVVLGLERLFIRDLSAWIYKAHEILGLLTFFGLFLGILCLLIHAMLRNRIYVLPALLVTTPLLTIGATQFWLYLEQRNLGWVDTSWREMGIPLWLSFAFWQWLAIGTLWLGMGLLPIVCDTQNNVYAHRSSISRSRTPE